MSCCAAEPSSPTSGFDERRFPSDGSDIRRTLTSMRILHTQRSVHPKDHPQKEGAEVRRAVESRTEKKVRTSSEP